MAYCSHCKIHGHELSPCRNKKLATLHEASPEQDQLTKTEIKNSAHTTKKHQGTEWREKRNLAQPSGDEALLTYGPDVLYKVTKATVMPDQSITILDSEVIQTVRQVDYTSPNNVQPTAYHYPISRAFTR